MSGITSETSDYTKLEGNAKIQTNSLEISAETIELSGEDFRHIKATGNVSGFHKEENLKFSCAEMQYDRQLKTALFVGSVHLVDNENDVIADAERINYNEETGIAHMQINVKLVQKDSLCTCAFAIYRKKQQLLEMSGNPQIVRGDDTFRAQEITFNLETEAITLDGRVRGTVTEESTTKKETN
ncbi:MAG: organic solvent tolerance protein OstA [Spirochaetaceae bacterium]|nr:organic solvent tolerance protein OstA [Spirochaetaceae bacterium]